MCVCVFSMSVTKPFTILLIMYTPSLSTATPTTCPNPHCYWLCLDSHFPVGSLVDNVNVHHIQVHCVCVCVCVCVSQGITSFLMVYSPRLVLHCRSLWNMRSYIHVMLCGSMFVAQLTFVVGVDKIDDKVECQRSLYSPLFLHVSFPVNNYFCVTKMVQRVCSGISALLVYLFLVTFMWKLMEGVVLYVALVKVFVTHNKRYIAAFTVFSFGQT